MADNGPSTPNKLVVVPVVHHISWATARAGPFKHVGGLLGPVDVLVIVAEVHHISRAAVRAGPSKHTGFVMCRAERPMKNLHLMGHGPARPIKFREDGPRPGPAHHICRRWAAARPDPSKFQWTGRDPTQPINVSFFTARPGPAHQFFKSLGPVHHIFKTFGPAPPGQSQVSDRLGPAQPRQTPHDKPQRCFPFFFGG